MVSVPTSYTQPKPRVQLSHSTKTDRRPLSLSISIVILVSVHAVSLSLSNSSKSCKSEAGDYNIFVLDSRGNPVLGFRGNEIQSLQIQFDKDPVVNREAWGTMDCLDQVLSPSSASALHSQIHPDSSISGLREKHQRELENLTLTTQPLRTLKYFVLAVIQCFWTPIFGWLMLLSILAGGTAILLPAAGSPHEELVQEFLCYLRFGVWWLALGVASSIGLGSGLHTFVLYLGPHIALFTIKSVHCGRVDIKSAPYDTIQLKTGPSWLDRDCSEYGPPLYSSPDSRVPLGSILHQVQLEAILWGIGTALGELPPYFISRAASLSGSKLEIMEDADSSLKEDTGVITDHLKQIKQWFISHSQHLNFFTILVLASVPNPLFDFAGIMCGQLGIPFWKFFSATLIGKAIIKTHIQTVFIISVCNNQLLDLIENEFVWVLSLVPGLGSVLPNLIAGLHRVKEKYMTASPPVSSNSKVKKWDLSVASIWNTVVWLILVNFSIKIMTATAQSFLKEQQDKELAALTKSVSS